MHAFQWKQRDYFFDGQYPRSKTLIPAYKIHEADPCRLVFMCAYRFLRNKDAWRRMYIERLFLLPDDDIPDDLAIKIGAVMEQVCARCACACARVCRCNAYRARTTTTQPWNAAIFRALCRRNRRTLLPGTHCPDRHNHDTFMDTDIAQAKFCAFENKSINRRSYTYAWLASCSTTIRPFRTAFFLFVLHLTAFPNIQLSPRMSAIGNEEPIMTDGNGAIVSKEDVKKLIDERDDIDKYILTQAAVLQAVRA
jgi:hypothetical protein